MKIGDTFTVKKVVTEDMTAAALGSGGLPVFGTPYLVAMVEKRRLHLSPAGAARG